MPDENGQETDQTQVDPLEELESRGRELASEIEALADLDELTEEQEARWGEATAEFDEVRSGLVTLRGERAERQRRDEVRARTREWAESHPEMSEGGSSQQESEEVRDRTAHHDLANPYTRFRNLDQRMEPRKYANEVRSLAHDAIERAPAYVEDLHRQTAASHIDREENGLIAEHCLATGSDEYRDAFTDYLRGRNPMGIGLYREGETRASLAEGNTGANLIPFYLDPTIILTNTGMINPFRAMSRVETITVQTWHGVTSGGVTGEWTAESTQVADASPTTTQPAITPVRADAHVQLTMEQIADSNITSQLAGLMADAKDRLEAAAFAVGTGSTQPTGIVTALDLVTASRVTSVTTAAYGSIDVFNLDNALPARYRVNASWVAQWSVYNATRQFSVGSGALSGAFWVTLGGGQPPELLGRPAYVSSAMTNSVTTSAADVLVLGDFKQGFVIVDRIGMSVLTNPYVVGNAGRPIGETGFTAFWRVGANTVNADAFRMLRLK
jgi:HK97 family phage major capsid protein